MTPARDAVVITIMTEDGPYGTIGAKFDIPGAHKRHEFAVHAPMPKERANGVMWSASHIATGMRITTGNTVEDTINRATVLWQRQTPENIARVIRSGMDIRRRVMSGERFVVEKKNAD